MAIDLKVTPEQRKQLQGIIKPKAPNKLVNPQEKIGEKIPKDFNAR